MRMPRAAHGLEPGGSARRYDRGMAFVPLRTTSRNPRTPRGTLGRTRISMRSTWIRRRDPVAAFIGVACSLAGLGSLWFGRSAVLAAATLGAAGIVLSVIGWRSAARAFGRRAVAVAGLAIGVIVAGIAFALLV